MYMYLYQQTYSRGQTERPHPHKPDLIDIIHLDCSEEARLCVVSKLLHIITPIQIC